MNQQIISVSEFVAILNETLAYAYPEVIIEGEVSSFKVNQGKWVFFDLKDSESALPCFMPLFSLKLPIEDGMKIRVTASPKLTKWGKFSLTVRHIELAGEGELKRAMALLKAKLEKEGLFDVSRKRPLPLFPQKIGLITSATSAAYSDFIKILNARWSGVTVVLADIQVQGLAAPDQIVNALNYFNATEPVDVLVLIRGGGSLEDLQAFSTEPVARAVAASRTPIIVGVGHEIDVSLADYAADVRAATPTDAARLVVPDRSDILHRLRMTEETLVGHMSRHILSAERHLERSLTAIERALRQPRERANRAEQLLRAYLMRFERHVANEQNRIENMNFHLADQHERYIFQLKQRLNHASRLLNGHNPSALLQRGYAIVRRGSQIITDPKSVDEHDMLMIQLAKGELRARPEQRHD